MSRQSSSCVLPTRFPHDGTAFFFDFDGTLAELAATPDAAVITPPTRDLLGALQALTEGAVAIVSGRAIASIDALLAPLVLPVAGLHGAERRSADGAMQRLAIDREALAHMEQTLAPLAERHPGMLLETKDAALALHYRNAPAAADVAREATERLVACHPGYVLQPGKMVYEIKPANVDKGRAIGAYLREAPFAGRMPVFAGDDLTDEKGFALVNRLDGVTLKVGVGQTEARQRVDSVKACLNWLGAVVNEARSRV